MKTSLLKKAALVVAAAVMCFSIPGCGKKDDGKLSKEDYVAAVQAKSDEITELSQNAMTDVDANNQEAVITATKDMAEKLKPLYNELGGLQAPEEFTEAQAKIKEGCDAAVRVLDISLELIELSADPESLSNEEALAKVQELQTEMVDLAAKADALQSAMDEVLGSAE